MLSKRSEATRVLSRSPEGEAVLTALRKFVGFPRAVIYDVPAEQAPRPFEPGSVYLRRSVAWDSYVRKRRTLDSGEFAAVIALRQLDDRERWLAVDWGSSYANTFLLIEPRRPDCDLSKSDNAVRRELEAAARPLAQLQGERNNRSRQSCLASVDGLLRDCYGAWTYWTGDRGSLEAVRVQLEASSPNETLLTLMQRHFPVRFPQAAFDRAMTELWRTERELFSGAVWRARIPFCTRLGLPLLHEPRYADRAFRRLVNAGHANVFRRDLDGAIRFGAGWPVPAEMPEHEFEQLML